MKLHSAQLAIATFSAFYPDRNPPSLKSVLRLMTRNKSKLRADPNNFLSQLKTEDITKWFLAKKNDTLTN